MKIMPWLRTGVLVVLFSMHVSLGAEAGPITLRSEVLDTQVCEYSSGEMQFLVDLRLHFKNVSQQTVILPRVWKLARAVLLGHPGSGEPIAKIEVPPNHSEPKATKLASDRPAFPFFVVLGPGGQYEGLDILAVIPLSPDLRSFGARGKEYLLEFDVRPFPRYDGHVLQDLGTRWRESGALFAQSIAAEAVVLHPSDSNGMCHCDHRITLGHGRQPGTHPRE